MPAVTLDVMTLDAHRGFDDPQRSQDLTFLLAELAEVAIFTNAHNPDTPLPERTLEHFKDVDFSIGHSVSNEGVNSRATIFAVHNALQEGVRKGIEQTHLNGNAAMKAIVRHPHTRRSIRCIGVDTSNANVAGLFRPIARGSYDHIVFGQPQALDRVAQHDPDALALDRHAYALVTPGLKVAGASLSSRGDLQALVVKLAMLK